MAYTTGSISCNAQTSGGSTRTLVFQWTLLSQSEKNNTSTIHWVVKGGGSNDGARYVTRETQAKINGVQVFYKGTSAVSVGYGEVVAQDDMVLTHDNNGNLNITLYLATAYNQWTINVSNTKSWALPKIKRASSISCGTLVMGSENTITVTKENSSFTHKISYAFGDTTASGIAAGKGAKGVVYEGSNTTVYWTPSLEEFAPIIPNATSGKGALTCDTYSGTSLIGSKSITFTINIPSSVKPVLENLNYELDNSANSVLRDVWKIALQGYTKIHLVISEDEVYGVYGSTISYFEITGEYSLTKNGTSLDYTGEVITTYGVKKFTVVAVDSRGRKTASKTVSVNFVEYSNPYITNFTSGRNSSDKNKLDVFFNAYYSSVNDKNSLSCILSHKEKVGATWYEYGEITPNTTTTIGDNESTIAEEFAWDKSYNLRITITDSLGNSMYIDGFVSTEEVAVDLGAGGKSVSFGKTAEIEKSVEITSQWDFYTHGKEIKELIFDCIYPIGSIYSTVVNENPKVLLGFGTWERWGSGKVPVGVDENNENFNASEKTGGKTDYKLSATIGAINNDTKSIAYIKEAKTKYQSDRDTAETYGGLALEVASGLTFDHWNHSTPVVEQDSSSREVKIMPPYITCYMWKRVDDAEEEITI